MSDARLMRVDQCVGWRASLEGRLVFTNGVFDLLHRGHVDLLERARALGDALVVGLNDDASAARLGKEPGRPVCSVADRARVVAALRAVDRVVVFGEDTPTALIAALRPDVLVKGDDYDADVLPGADLVRSGGGRVVTIPRTPDCSTTTLLERIRGTE